MSQRAMSHVLCKYEKNEKFETLWTRSFEGKLERLEKNGERGKKLIVNFITSFFPKFITIFSFFFLYFSVTNLLLIAIIRDFCRYRYGKSILPLFNRLSLQKDELPDSFHIASKEIVERIAVECFR